ncbi:hypothetical protein ACHAXR_003156 [Thalassiosira sp. AJA248-18]
MLSLLSSRSARPVTAAAAATRRVAIINSQSLPSNAAASATTTTAARRHFAKKIIDIRRSEQLSIWSAYLSGSTSETSLFAEIDLNKSGTISVEEIGYFLDSVDRSGVNPKKFELLEQLGSDHQLDKKEFHRWLCMATDVKNDGTGFVTNESDSSSSSSDSSSDEEASSSTAADAAPPKKKKIVDARRGLQEIIWENFLTTGQQASDLFKMIDLNRSSKISVEEITYFIDSIGSKGISHGKFNELKALGEAHELNEAEFYEWLGSATGMELSDDGEYEHSSVRDDGEGCTPGQW